MFSKKIKRSLTACLSMAVSAYCWQSFLDLFNNHIEGGEDDSAGMYVARNLFVGLGESVVSLILWFLAGKLAVHEDLNPKNAAKLFAWGVFNGASWRLYADFGEKLIYQLINRNHLWLKYLLGSLTIVTGMFINAGLPQVEYVKRYLFDISALLPEKGTLILAECAFYLEEAMPMNFLHSPEGNRGTISGGLLAFSGALFWEAGKNMLLCKRSDEERQPLLTSK